MCNRPQDITPEVEKEYINIVFYTFVVVAVLVFFIGMGIGFLIT